ncbi:putative fungal fucose-specific lectin [Diplodia seriata]|uniref:Putative fungal fucose-specific lectin n=1 Tax=Diplodia seriata TaxID=420778 RepID=A0A0G2EU26_9PEZI|nr:putative fungal fucose-specific lectin [Diplodia seriata]
MSNDWSMEHKLDDQDLPVGTDSGLATYGPECPSENACDENNFVIYGITGGKQYICYPFVDDGKPYQLKGYNYNGADSGAGKLVEMYGYLGHWGMSTFDLPTSIDDGGQLAAMNLHTTAQGSNTTDVLNSWVFITQSTGGVKLVYGGGFVPGDAWNSIDSIKNMEDVVPLSPVAATQAGKVYALEEKDDGTRRIVEWRRESGDDITFERLKEVETPE